MFPEVCSQNTNWTNLKWPGQVNPVTWRVRLCFELIGCVETRTLSARCRWVMNTCNPMRLYIMEFANRVQFSSCDAKKPLCMTTVFSATGPNLACGIHVNTAGSHGGGGCTTPSVTSADGLSTPIYSIVPVLACTASCCDVQSRRWWWCERAAWSRSRRWRRHVWCRDSDWPAARSVRGLARRSWEPCAPSPRAWTHLPSRIYVHSSQRTESEQTSTAMTVKTEKERKTTTTTYIYRPNQPTHQENSTVINRTKKNFCLC